ncbi:MAG: TlpA disulfide reductase family protein [Bryobacteraceae bacterium]
MKKREMIAAGEPAAGFELYRLDGGKASLAELTASGPAVVAFFKISCPTCQLTMPYLGRIHAGGKLAVYGVSQDDESATRSFNQRFGVKLPTLLDAGAEGYPASNAYGITHVPSIFVVEPDGKVSAAWTGFSRRDMEALGERAGSPPFEPGEQVPGFKAG